MESGGELANFADGPALIGIFMNTMLYGAMLTQTFFYFSSYKKDPVRIKYYVAILFFADTLNTIFNIWWIYGVLVNNFGNLEALGIGNWLFETEEALAGIIAMMVQGFYAWRILRLTQNYWLVAAVLVPSIAGGLGGIGTAIGVAIRPEFAGLQSLEPIVLTWLAGAAISDTIIAVTLVWHLYRSRTGYSRTDTMVSRIIQLTLSNGLLTASFALADIISYLITTRGYHIGFNYVLCKLYGNSVMSSLNARSIINATSRDTGYAHESLGGDTNPNNINQIVSSKSARPTQVMVNVETHEMVDVNKAGMRTDEEWNGAHRSDDSDVKAGIVV